MKKRCVILILFVAFALAARGADAQGTTGTIAGRVVDAQGLAIPGVSVTVTGAQGVKSAVTDADGRFTVPFLTPGSYAVHVELQGFNSVDRSSVIVPLGQTVEIPVTLQVGELTETVKVEASTAAIDTTSTTIGANLDSATLR